MKRKYFPDDFMKFVCRIDYLSNLNILRLYLHFYKKRDLLVWLLYNCSTGLFQTLCPKL